MSYKAELLADAIIDAADWLEEEGYYDLAYKRRDRNEPGRRMKERTELLLDRFFTRYLRRQRSVVIERAELLHPERKYTDAELMEWQSLFASEDELAVLVRLFTDAARNGVNIFSDMVLIGLDYSLTNAEAAQFARQYAYSLIGAHRQKDGTLQLGSLDEATLQAVRQGFSMFVETPGMTMGDLKGQLRPYFNEVRVQRIAVTETTRVYSEGQAMAGRTLAKEFPDMHVVKKWYTSQDELVCPICAPLPQRGWIMMDQEFAPKIDNPPAHVNCRCAVSYSTEITEQP